ncbi:MAG: response regulator transcription factor [Candidatus Eremiobacteraeota bacterium]|uniref:Two-component response regulator (YvqE) responding to cell wall stress n=1 Tax=mine drainage metagenome TaxID=410659 RepID=E6PCU9_9ZZZZ|nr:response regulator transcription factor [Candidatus Eremiobacteraeota bacterium]
MSALRVVVVEDHALTRMGLCATLAAADIEVVGEAGDGPTGRDLIMRERPDVAIVDIGLPGIDGIELTEELRAMKSTVHIVILTMVDEEPDVLAALAAGADAYCLKSGAPERLIEAIRVAAEGGAYFDPRIAHIVLRQFTTVPGERIESPLSPRETEILRLIAEGVGNAEIAERLVVSLGTVKSHIRDTLIKLSASDRTQAAVIALRRGFI